MDQIKLIENKINHLVKHLSSIKEQDRQDGWTDELVQKYFNHFSDIRGKIAQRQKIPFHSYARALDFSGVQQGELLSEICSISDDIEKLGLFER